MAVTQMNFETSNLSKFKQKEQRNPNSYQLALKCGTVTLLHEKLAKSRHMH